MSNDTPAPGTGTTFDPKAENPQTKTPKENESSTNNTPGTVTLTQEQFDTLIKRLEAGDRTDKAPAPSFTPGVGLQTNPFGQVVGTVTKFNIDPNYYPNPVEDLLDDFDRDRRLSRLNIRDNFYISWDITAKPYQTKDNLSVQEPTFHVTIHQNRYDDEGNDTGEFIIRKTLHFNEDEELARLYAAEQGIEVNDEQLRDLLDKVRYQRVRDFIVEYFFPPRNFDLNTDSQELAIDGAVVKVITKSNVKGWDKAPKITDEELS